MMIRDLQFTSFVSGMSNRKPLQKVHRGTRGQEPSSSTTIVLAS